MNYLGNGTFTFSEIPFFATVGKYCSLAEGIEFINPHTHLCTENRDCVYTTNWDQPEPKDKVVIGNDVWIGYGVKILPGVTIGNGAIIGAYAVIAKDVPPYAVVVGNPQVVKRFRFTKEQIEKLEKIKWWDWDKKEIDKNIEVMKNINKFLKLYET